MSSLKLESSAFGPSEGIPRKYTCEGENLAPPLRWHGVPTGTQSLALIVDDPDAPDPAAPKRVWVHWVVYNLPVNSEGLPEGGKLPPEASAGTNDFKRTGYGGPCPPIGRHRYFHKLYALDTTLGNLGQPDKAKLEAAMKGHVLEQTQLIGTYQKASH
jgi:Raf kinase inhibitor-like YbhB/YbcL family protein